jgi:hypothetical protein
MVDHGHSQQMLFQNPGVLAEGELEGMRNRIKACCYPYCERFGVWIVIVIVNVVLLSHPRV